MIRLLVDEDFNNDILRGLRRRVPDLDAPRVQAIGLGGEPDQAVLAYAASENRIVLTHDVSTMVGYAYERVQAGDPMPGVTWNSWSWSTAIGANRYCLCTAPITSEACAPIPARAPSAMAKESACIGLVASPAAYTPGTDVSLVRGSVL